MTAGSGFLSHAREMVPAAAEEARASTAARRRATRRVACQIVRCVITQAPVGWSAPASGWMRGVRGGRSETAAPHTLSKGCLLYTSDAADERSSVDLGGRRIIK